MHIYIYIYIYIYSHSVRQWSGRGGRVIQETQKIVLDTCLHYKAWIKLKWRNPGKGVVPSSPPRYYGYWKGNLWIALHHGRNWHWFTTIDCQAIGLYICLSKTNRNIYDWYLSIYVSWYISIYLSINLSIYLSMCVCVCVHFITINLSFYRSI